MTDVNTLHLIWKTSHASFVTCRIKEKREKLENQCYMTGYSDILPCDL